MRHKLKFSRKSPAKEGGMPFFPTSSFPLLGTPKHSLYHETGPHVRGGRAVSWESLYLYSRKQQAPILLKSLLFFYYYFAVRVNFMCVNLWPRVLHLESSCICFAYCCGQFEILNNIGQGALCFYFEVGPENYIAGSVCS